MWHTAFANAAPGKEPGWIAGMQVADASGGVLPTAVCPVQGFGFAEARRERRWWRLRQRLTSTTNILHH